jgi:hypothetical protein
VFLLIVVHVPGVIAWAQDGAVVPTIADSCSAWATTLSDAAAIPRTAAARRGRVLCNSKAIDGFL